MVMLARIVIASSLIVNILLLSNLYVSKAEHETSLINKKTSIKSTTLPITHKANENKTILFLNDKLQAQKKLISSLESELHNEKQQGEHYQRQITQLKEDMAKVARINNMASNTRYSACIDSFIQSQQMSNNETDSFELIGETISDWKKQLVREIIQQIKTETDGNALFLLAKQLYAFDLDIQEIDHHISYKLLKSSRNMNEEQQGEILYLLTGSLNHNDEAALPDLEPLLLSDNNDVQEEAFLRLEELGLSENTKPYFEYLSLHSTNNWIRNEAVKTLSAQKG